MENLSNNMDYDWVYASVVFLFWTFSVVVGIAWSHSSLQASFAKSVERRLHALMCSVSVVFIHTMEIRD